MDYSSDSDSEFGRRNPHVPVYGPQTMLECERGLQQSRWGRCQTLQRKQRRSPEKHAHPALLDELNKKPGGRTGWDLYDLLADKSFVLRFMKLHYGPDTKPVNWQYNFEYRFPYPARIPYATDLYNNDFDFMLLAYSHFRWASKRLKADKTFVRCVLERVIQDPVKMYTNLESAYDECRSFLKEREAQTIRLDIEIGRLARDVYAFERDARFSNDRSFVMEAMAEMEAWDLKSKNMFHLPGFLHHDKEAVMLAIKLNVGHRRIVGGEELLREDMDVFQAVLLSGAQANLNSGFGVKFHIFCFHDTRLIETEAAVCAAARVDTEFLAGFPQDVRNHRFLMLAAIKIDPQAMKFVFGSRFGDEPNDEQMPEVEHNKNETLFGSKSFAVDAIHAAPKAAEYINSTFKNDEDVHAAIRRPFNNRLVACVARFKVMADSARERLYNPDRGVFIGRAAKRFRTGDYDDEYIQTVVDGNA